LDGSAMSKILVHESSTPKDKDLCSEVKNLLRLCEQSRIYCDVAQSKTEDEELQLLLKLMSEERNQILVELIRYLRAHGRRPDEFFSHVFRYYESWKDDSCPANVDGVFCAVYLSEKEMLRILSELKEQGDPHLKSLAINSYIKSGKISKNLLARISGGQSVA
jgi:hypothetical protein